MDNHSNFHGNLAYTWHSALMAELLLLFCPSPGKRDGRVLTGLAHRINLAFGIRKENYEICIFDGFRNVDVLWPRPSCEFAEWYIPLQ